MSGLFMSKSMRKARGEIGQNRTSQELIETSNNLYETLLADIKKAKKTSGMDYTTYTPDRKIGKTYSLIRLAIEYDYSLIVHNSGMARIIQRETKKRAGKDITVLSFDTITNQLYGMHYDVLLKDEMVDMVKLRDKLNNNGLSWMNIVGVN